MAHTDAAVALSAKRGCRQLRRVALLIWVPALACSQQQVTAVRFWSLGKVTRIAVETDGPVRYRADRLHNPERLFFDLFDTVPLPEYRRKVQVFAVEDGLIKQIRVALTRPRVTRVVLDLVRPVQFLASQLANPDRLIIELRPDAESSLAPAGDLPEPPGLLPRETKLAGGRAPRWLAEPAVPLPPAPIAQAPNVASAGQAGIPPGAPRSAQRDSRGGRSLIRALGLKVEKVVIDPGHGGHDTGTIGPSGLKEKDLALDLALRLGRLVSERMGCEVIYTRTEDVYVPLEARTELANQSRADLFLSIHANGSRLRSASGPEAYYLNFTTDASALELAARENATSSRGIHELQDLIQKIAQKEKVQESREFAASIQKALYAGLRSGKNRGVKKAPFLVLVGAQMPSVLVEVAFLSNPREERLLKQPEYRQRVAEALYRGLFSYASTLSHFQLARGASE